MNQITLVIGEDLKPRVMEHEADYEPGDAMFTLEVHNLDDGDQLDGFVTKIALLAE